MTPIKKLWIDWIDIFFHPNTYLNNHKNDILFARIEHLIESGVYRTN